MWHDVENAYDELGQELPMMAKLCKVDIAQLSKEFDKVQTPAKPAKSSKVKAKKPAKGKKAKKK